jgi:hypothetical protein
MSLFVPVERLEPRRMLAVTINEILAGNTTGVRDADGDRSDWIELHNDGASSVDLTGWYLTDDSAALTKWQFPATTISPNGYLLVFASDKNRAVSGQELHTNFKLTNAGEFLALVAADGSTIVDSFNPFPEQKDDVSFGRGVSASSTVAQTLVGASTTVKAYSPVSENATIDDHFREIDYDDSAWWTGTRSVGFDRDGNPDLTPYIGLALPDTAAGMPSTTNARFSAYVRFPFTLSAKEQLTSLQMSLRFDDGFIAYLNGKEIRRVNFAEDFQRPQPQWNSFAGYQLTSSTSSSANRAGEALTPITFDLTPYLSTLVNGTNVLSFHGVNSNSTANSNENRKDFLIEPVLAATRATGTAQSNKFLPHPSPGSENGYAVDGKAGDTHFSVDRGFFASPFQTTITSTTPGVSIRYTLDGSEPSETTGTLYTGPINISQTTILRAIAYKAGFLPSNVDTETYIFPANVIQQSAADVTQSFGTWGHDKGDADAASGVNLDDESDWDMDSRIVTANASTIINDLKAVPSVSVVMNWNDLFNPTPQPGSVNLTTTVSPAPQGIYIAGRSDERAASFEFFNPNNLTDQFHADAAIEIQGHSSPTRWNTDKLSFQVKFKYPYGETAVDYPVFTGTADGAHATSRFDTFVLDAGYNNTWLHANNRQYNVARYVSDQAISDLQNLAGGHAAHGKFVHLYLNGLYWGLYNLHERTDDSFAAQYLGGNKDDYDVVKHASDDPTHKYTWVEGGVTAENAFASLLFAAANVSANPNNSATYQALENLLDVDGFIDYMIVNYYGGNVIDWSNNNWYASRSRVDPDGKWRFHSWDSEHAFPTDDNQPFGDSVGEDADATEFDQNETPTAIHQDLIANPEYRQRFADRVQKLLFNEGILTPTNAAAVYQARVNEINRAIVGESARWGDSRVAADPVTRDDFLNIASGVMNDFFPVRTGILLNQFDARGWLPTIDAPLFGERGGTVSPGFSLTLNKPAGTPTGAKIYYTLDGTDPRLIGGALSPSAIEYTSPITLNLSTRVRARILSSTTWSAIDESTFNIAGTYPLRIVEFHYNPPVTPGIADEQNLEFFELLNTGTSPINLDGVQITQFSSTPYVFSGGVTLAGGARIVVAKHPAVFTSYYGSGINLMSYGYGTQNLSNGGERIALLSPLGETLQDFTYDDVAPWPTGPDGNGPSLEIIDPLGDPTNPANWRASSVSGGTPGTATIIDNTPPTIVSSTFDFEHQTIIVQFSEDVQASLQPADVKLQPAPSGSEFSPASFTWTSTTHTAVFSFSDLVADGNYRIRIPAGSITDASGNTLASEHLSDPFFLLQADATRSRFVDTNDFNILAANFGSTDKVFSEGNFNYDALGKVDSEDFNLFIAQYGKRLSVPTAPVISPFSSFEETTSDDLEI